MHAAQTEYTRDTPTHPSVLLSILLYVLRFSQPLSQHPALVSSVEKTLQQHRHSKRLLFLPSPPPVV